MEVTRGGAPGRRELDTTYVLRTGDLSFFLLILGYHHHLQSHLLSTFFVLTVWHAVTVSKAGTSHVRMATCTFFFVAGGAAKSWFPGGWLRPRINNTAQCELMN